jgi:NAD(P)-dependent dehydrogenase (short-subunit alcohol dehydrogenase family)
MTRAGCPAGNVKEEKRMKLKDKVVLVTGGGRGIGREIALSFAGAGAKIAVSARSPEQLDEVVGAIKETGGDAIAIPADVSNEEDVHEIVEETMRSFGQIDVLINNAGILGPGPIASVDSAEWRRVIEVNLLGTFYCSKAVTPILISRGWGRIINVSSRSGKIGHPFMTAYCASKHGVVGFTKALAEELMPFNITVNAICPGLVDTDMATDTVREQVGDKIIKPSQIAELALYLAGDAASAVTGEAINIFGATKLNLNM